MTSSPDNGKIIRGIIVEGVVFCSPKGHLASSPKSEEESHLRALEEFWHNKGLQEGKGKGFDEGFQEGLKAGHAKGLHEGSEKGLLDGTATGLDEGFQKGYEKGRVEFAEGLKLVTDMVTKFKEERGRLLEQARPELIKFSMTVCEIIMRQELADPKAYTRLLEALIVQAKPVIKNESVDIYLNPEDKALLQGSLDKIRELAPEVSAINYIADTAVLRGDCFIETPRGLLNFDVKRQLLDLQGSILSHSHQA